MPKHSDVSVYCLDYDGCTDKASARTAIIERIVFLALENVHCKKIIIMIGSLRQSVYLDFHNTHNYYEEDGRKYYSCSVLSRSFMAELNTMLHAAYAKKTMPVAPPEIEFNPLLTCDIYNNLIPGTTVSLMDAVRYQQWRQTTGPVILPVNDEFNTPLSKLNKLEFQHWQARRDPLKFLINSNTGEEIPTSDEWRYISWRETRHPVELTAMDKDGQPVSLFEWKDHAKFSSSSSVALDDPSKTLMLYMFIHDTALKLGPHQSFNFTLVDDKLSIFTDMVDFFRKNLHLLPSTCTLQGVEMSSDEEIYPPFSQTTSLIEGTGIANSNYQMVLQEIARTVPNDTMRSKIICALVTIHRASMRALLSESTLSVVSNAPHSTYFGHSSTHTTAVAQNEQTISAASASAAAQGYG